VGSSGIAGRFYYRAILTKKRKQGRAVQVVSLVKDIRMQIPHLGAYSPYTCDISAEAKKAFEQAMQGFVGVKYTPVAVSTQVVSGLNYKFFCNSVAATLMPLNGAAIVSIYAPINEPARLQHIQSL